MALCSFTSIVSSRAGGHHFLSSRPADPTKAPSRQPTNNGSIHAECSLLRNIMASAAEAESGALYINSQTTDFFAPLSSKWAIPNRQRPSRPTNPRPMASSTHLYANGVHVQWTCDSIGYTTPFAKTIFLFIGNPAERTLVTISPSIIRRPTTKPCAPHILLKPLFALQIALQVVCEGVLILAFHTLQRPITQLITHRVFSCASHIC
jgi:hypothetical protein